MGGYLVNYFKYPPADINAIQENEALGNQIETDNYSLVRNVVWSNLDRIEVRRINDFNKFRSAEESEKNWIGERQYTLLYDLIDESKAKLKYRDINNSEDRCRFRFEPVHLNEKEDRDDFRFFGMSTVNLSPLIHEYIYSQENPREFLHEEISNVLNQLCQSESAAFLDSKLKYEIYGTLGAADCVIVWLVNQYTDVIALVEALREIKCFESEYLVSNVFTIMGLTNPLADGRIFEGSKGIFNLRLIKRGGFSLEAFKKTLSDYVDPIDDVNIVLGKYDISITFKSASIKKNLYREGGPIHFRTPDYYRAILEAHTELMQKPGTEHIQPVAYSKPDIKQLSTAKVEAVCYSTIKQSIEEVTKADIFCEMPYLGETLWLLYQDFVKNVASEFSYPWSVDLAYSFQKSMDYLQEILEEQSDMQKGDVIDFIQKFIESIRQTILHISQASKLYFEIPNSHLKQTEGYSKILRAYYGIIKQLLKIAYGMSRISQQSEIIPFITFDVNPKAESEFCQSFFVLDKRVVNFKLPYEALTDIVKYSKLLAHEVYHYIAPERRDIRNFLFGCIFWTEIIKSIIFNRALFLFLKSKKRGASADEWAKNSGIICRILKADIWNSVVNNYDILMERYVVAPDCLWSEYYKCLNDRAVNAYQKDAGNIAIIGDIIKDIVSKKLQNRVKDLDDEKGLQGVVEAIVSDVKDKNFKKNFTNWYISGDVLKLVGPQASDYVDACREACADYYMIQVTGMELKEYILTTMEFVHSFESNGEIHFMQECRVGMLLHYIWSLEGELTDEDIKQRVAALDLNEEQTDIMQRIWNTYLQYGALYKKAFGYLFSTIRVDNNDEIDVPFEEFHKKVSQHFKGYHISDFDSNLSIIEKMQNQQPLEEIFTKPNKMTRAMMKNVVSIDSMKKDFCISTIENNESTPYVKIYESIPPVQSLEGLIEAFEQVSKEIRDEYDEILWFRGHSSDEYRLLPSLYRLKSSMETSDSRPIKQMMEDLTYAFRVKAFHVPEIYPEGNSTIIGTLVSMQHYSVATNLLDWSQQIFSALYFALEEYINNPEKEKAEKNARVYILNPARFNKSMEKILGLKTGGNHFVIPSLLENDERFARYLPILKALDGVDGYGQYNYPMAIYTPYVNQRIKAQAGCFTIFSLSVDNDQDVDGKAYKRFDLQLLQDECLEKAKDSFKPFLSYIDIDKEYIPLIAKSVKTMGITKQNIYPELSNIASEMNSEIKKYFKD